MTGYRNYKYNPEKANNAKYSETITTIVSGLLPHSARKRGGLILQLPSPQEERKWQEQIILDKKA